MIYITALEAPLIRITIHPSRASQITNKNPMQNAILKQNKVPIKI